MFALKENLKIEPLAKSYSELERISVKNILTTSSALSLREYLLGMPEWNLAFKVGDKHFDVSATGFAQLDSIERDSFLREIYLSAGNDFGYMYKNCPIYDLVKVNKCPQFLEVFYEYINSQEFIKFLKGITGFENIDFLDAQATCYDAGHFLTSHDDVIKGKNRLAAFVFNFSQEWKSEWGGNLTFYNSKGEVDDVFVPSFNSLSLFTVGKQHAVTMVNKSVEQSRFAITGWLRYK